MVSDPSNIYYIFSKRSFDLFTFMILFYSGKLSTIISSTYTISSSSLVYWKMLILHYVDSSKDAYTNDDSISSIYLYGSSFSL